MQSPRQNENFVNTSKKVLEKEKLNSSCSALFHMKTRVSLMNDCWLPFFWRYVELGGFSEIGFSIHSQCFHLLIALF